MGALASGGGDVSYMSMWRARSALQCVLLTVHRAAGWVTRISKDEKAANMRVLKEKHDPLRSCFLHVLSLMSSCILPLHPRAPRGHPRCVFLQALLSIYALEATKAKGLERKLCSVSCTSQYIYWWGYSRRCHSFREWFFSQSNPERKQGKASFQKPLVQFLWIKNLWWGGERKMLCSCDWIRYNLCPFRGYFPLPE